MQLYYTTKKILLCKRANKPAQGQWWFPGGRIHKGETMVEAVQRKMQEEIGQKVTIVKNLGTDETIFPDGPFGNTTHTINTVFLVKLKNADLIRFDNQHTEFKWFTTLPVGSTEYIGKYFKKANGIII